MNSTNQERKVTCEQIYDYMEDSEPLVSTYEIAGEFSVSDVTARKRLNELAGEGQIVEEKIHPSTSVWYLSSLTE